MLIFCYQEDFNGDWVSCGDTLKEEQPATFPCQRSRCEYAGNLANNKHANGKDTIAAVQQL